MADRKSESPLWSPPSMGASWIPSSRREVSRFGAKVVLDSAPPLLAHSTP